MAYDYRESVKTDILDYIKNNVDGHIDDNRSNELYDEMFVSDAVTGNGSGSYTFSQYEAEENLCHNLRLLNEACEDLCSDPGQWLDDPEGADVTIRCYLLGELFGKIVDEWNASHPEKTDGV